MINEKIIELFSDEPKPKDSKNLRAKILELSEDEKEKLRSTLSFLIQRDEDQNSIEFLVKLYACLYGSGKIYRYYKQIRRDYPSHYQIIARKLGIHEHAGSYWQSKEGLSDLKLSHISSIISDNNEYNYIKKNLIFLFPNRIHLANTLLEKINKLSYEEIILFAEYLKITLKYDDFLNQKIYKEVKKIFIQYGYIRLYHFYGWFFNCEKSALSFRIILIYHLFTVSSILDLTSYILVCPLNFNEDNSLIAFLEQSIIDHLCYTSKNQIIQKILYFNYSQGPINKHKLFSILAELDQTEIENFDFVTLEDIETIKITDMSKWFDNSEVNKVKTVNNRPNQSAFRDSVMKAYGSVCSVCGIKIKSLLEAAHIIPKKYNGIDIEQNGIPLCALHHRAYDANLFCINPDTFEVVVNPEGPSHEEIMVSNRLNEDLITIPPYQVLAWRWNYWIQKIQK